MYHGSRENFYEFKRWTDGLINSGHFFSPDRKNALGYGGNIYDVYLNLRNPLEVDAQGANFSSIEYGGEKVAASDLGNLAEMEGYDGVVISDVADSADMGSENDRTVDYISFAANQNKNPPARIRAASLRVRMTSGLGRSARMTAASLWLACIISVRRSCLKP